MRVVTIREEFTIFTICLYGFIKLKRLKRRLGLVKRKRESISLTPLHFPTVVPPCCFTSPACSTPMNWPVSARRWSRPTGPTARSRPATSRPRPSTTCSWPKATRWPRKSAVR
ncbi:protein of unknown function [Pseudomonas sp. JV551A1]|nr:protein of unknown function [Pseudomonas sp. JV551A1]